MKFAIPGGATFRSYWAERRVRWTAYVFLLLAIAWAAFYYFFIAGLPSTDALLTYEPPLPTNVRSIDGTPVYSFARERRVQLNYDEFPPLLVQAFISAEDKNFFTHHGVAPLKFGNAVIAYFTHYGSGERAHGGSTITQQVAKNLLLNAAYSPTRKVREAVLAIRIENSLNKQQILELYLNQIFLGRNAYGVQSAARAYFGKDVDQLTVPEAAYLATLPRAPSNYDPDRHADRALDRRRYVLKQMQANGYITAAQEADADATPLGTVHRSDARLERERAFEGYYMEEVRRELMARYGEADENGPHGVYTGGLWVRTSLDPKVQKAAEDALRAGLIRFEGGGWRGRVGAIDAGDGWPARLAALDLRTGYADWRAAVILSKSRGEAVIGFSDGTQGTLPASGAAMAKRNVGGHAFDFLRTGDVIIVGKNGSNWSLRTIPGISGGFVAENPHTGQVLAMQGGFDAREPFNRATQALRQPGSAFKPMVYTAALDSGLTPASILDDEPFCVFQTRELGTKCFKNFTNSYAGPQTMRWGVEQSRNLMTVRAASTAGMDKVVDYAKRFGIGTYPPYIAYSLGAGETTVLRMVNAYSMLANQGRSLKPTLIDYVQDRHGKVIWRADTRPCEGCNAKDWNGGPMPRPISRSTQVIDAMTAYQMVHIMEGVVQRGTAVVLRSLNRPLFGKTGTNSGPTNVWFVGGSPDLVGGVYIGYDRPRPMGAYAQGGTLAAPIFLQFAQVAMKDMPVVPFKVAPGIRMVAIDRRSGRKIFGVFPNDDDPKPAAIWEAFKPESEPRRAIGKEAVTPLAKPKAAQNDSDFLAKQGGIY
ncbi:penicillin-binding protein 1A [Sphingomonas vulcanisoli]|uniref:Penicillin-binding protein 1A n=1 Tax=Sphingomonas vulcanisoli TaxID=1658060 RepID=A0ABX0TQB6_9SPHN|nr:PBP1A family penicillin-binding protein [Sphingomonas vulcanisoli]NIJ07723.1 penicillin-binding protein 1A [Sphingomonas vulcanisoli]